MDNHHFLHKVSRLFPSSLTSCQFRNLSDVAESSINPIPLHASLSPKNPSNKTKPPPINRSSISTASCSFTTTDDDTFFSLSSNSGDSFHLPTTTSNRFKTRHEMKSIDETARCSFSSATSLTTGGGGGRKPSRTCVVAEREQCSDQILTQMYYNDKGLHRRKGGGNRRRMKKSRSVIGESYAVEKRSRDPRGDFRASMVEMIVEKRIFAAAELERLLRCFLSLNSTSYHGMIFDVFSEICQTLFTN